MPKNRHFLPVTSASSHLPSTRFSYFSFVWYGCLINEETKCQGIPKLASFLRSHLPQEDHSFCLVAGDTGRNDVVCCLSLCTGVACRAERKSPFVSNSTHAGSRIVESHPSQTASVQRGVVEVE